MFAPFKGKIFILDLILTLFYIFIFWVDKRDGDQQNEGEFDHEAVGGGQNHESDYEDEVEVAPVEEPEQLPADLPADVDPRLHPHGFSWTPNHHQNVDNAYGKYTGGGFKVKSWPDDGRGRHDERSSYEYFMKVFPVGIWDDIVDETIVQLWTLGRGVTTKGELVKCMGMRLSMVLEKISVDAAFATETVAGSAKLPANYSKRYGMSKDRFQILEKCFRYAAPAPDDAWAQPRAFVNAFNHHMQDAVSPGDELCVDEAMAMWLGRDKKYAAEGCPGITKIQRKPRGVGVELKACADAESRVMLRLELMEGKDAMREKQWANVNAGTGHILRLTRPWHGTARTVVGDSAFASVTCAVWCYYFGLFFMGIVKTATTKYPKKYLVEWFEENEARDPQVIGWRGSHMCLTADAKLMDFIPADQQNAPIDAQQTVQIFALCWADRKPKNVISSRGTTLPGTNAHVYKHTPAQITTNHAHTYIIRTYTR